LYQPVVLRIANKVAAAVLLSACLLLSAAVMFSCWEGRIEDEEKIEKGSRGGGGEAGEEASSVPSSMS
jgi:hypothetical protein